MGVRRKPRSELIRDLGAEHGWKAIRETEWLVLTEAVPGLRTEDVRASGFPADAPWHGVSLHTFEDLRNSLCAFTEVYEHRIELRAFCRREVIRAKERARYISNSSYVAEPVRRMKQEMVEWLLIWLSDPAIFPVWSDLRTKISHAP